MINKEEFLELCNNCQQTQENVLAEIIKVNSESEFGKKYDFASIKTTNEYREKLPISDWKDLDDYIVNFENGASNQLFMGKPALFIITSGTTGKEKLLPESEKGIEIKKEIGMLRMSIIKKFFPKAFEGKLLPMVNKSTVGFTESGIPFGSASGVTLITASKSLRESSVFPFDVLDTNYPDTMDYLIMRFAVEKDIRFIVGNNAGRIEQLITVAKENSQQIIEDIRNGEINSSMPLESDIREKLLEKLSPNPSRAEELSTKILQGELTPNIYWPNLTLISCWLGGSIGNYARKMRHLFPNIPFFDFGYGASEGKFNIPLKPETTAGPLAIFGVFFEFLPLDHHGKTLYAHELTDGEMYEIIITTYSGLYRYPLHDIIKVEGFTGTTPNIVFVSKSTDTANLCGEKILSDKLIEIVDIINKTDIEVKHWCLVTDKDDFCYNFCIEPKIAKTYTQEELENLAARLEIELRNNATHIYGVFRNQNLIKPAEVSIMKSGWYDAWRKSKTKKNDSGSQLKLPVVNEIIPVVEFLLQSSKKK